ncbi:hypothetical protein EYF80_000351 [Liparis tanakae]|uniref:Uncharacterized protein n=1 Tax=Liparis tanakae TaxID=230148 RepID=A0A4Z2JGR9_9TELE|nr:hypothetical protein EYF80_000351 [Liparis tanakae]
MEKKSGGRERRGAVECALTKHQDERASSTIVTTAITITATATTERAEEINYSQDSLTPSKEGKLSFLISMSGVENQKDQSEPEPRRRHADADSWAQVCRHTAYSTSEGLPLVPMSAAHLVTS